MGASNDLKVYPVSKATQHLENDWVLPYDQTLFTLLLILFFISCLLIATPLDDFLEIFNQFVPHFQKEIRDAITCQETTKFHLSQKLLKVD